MIEYPKYPDFEKLGNLLRDHSSLKAEVGAQGMQNILDEVEEMMKAAVSKLENLKEDKDLQEKEPDDLEGIKKLRPKGPRRYWQSIDENVYEEKLKGAFLARLAGCTLGAPVEFWSVEAMKNWAEYSGDSFPPTDYWLKTKSPNELRYTKGDFVDYTRGNIKKVPVDDDITYTLLCLIMVEKYGFDFTREDVASAWSQYLPMAYTAEEMTLNNLKKGIPPENAGDIENPYYQWIGADIRSDGFAYMAPAYPEKAAELAYKDGSLSHRRNGVYGEMFFAAAQSAAFYVEDSLEAIRIGLTEIPKECLLAKDIEWALDMCEKVSNYQEARDLVDKRFDGMSHAHTNSNACLTVFGLKIGGRDVTKVISETVAMGMDNDCTAATAGSIIGAIVGFSGIEKHWYEPFNNCVDTYLNGVEALDIDDVLNRFISLGYESMKI